MDDILSNFTKREKNQLLKVASTFSKLPEVRSKDVAKLMREMVDAHSDVVVRNLMESVQQEDDRFQETFWGLVHEFSLVDARRVYTIIQARLQTISKLREAVEGGATEVPEIHNIVRKHAWLLDPRWDLLDDEVDVAKLGVEFEPEKDSETGLQLDFLFVLQPRSPAKIDDVIVVEIKRGSLPSGKSRKANDAEISKFQNYVSAIQAFYEKSTHSPRVRGLMIAQDYTERANRLRKQLEQIGEPKYEFKSWPMVLSDTERLHISWLEISRIRSIEEK